jgi:hypothetical protein
MLPLHAVEWRMFGKEYYLGRVYRTQGISSLYFKRNFIMEAVAIKLEQYGFDPFYRCTNSPTA